ncbi:MAG TPA: toxin [Gammaproteobacteria bacterium]|nr:toxin [Gammaproteobacteria bacterium]
MLNDDLVLNWNTEKNKQLKQERGLCFEDVEIALSTGGFVDDQPHPNQERFPNQQLLIVLIDGYPCVVPYVRDNEKLFLKTIYPSRKLKSLL